MALKDIKTSCEMHFLVSEYYKIFAVSHQRQHKSI